MLKNTDKIREMNFPQFFELKFIEWQRTQGGRRTVLEFAKYLGIAQATASSYMTGARKPDGEALRKLALKLGIEIYDTLGIDRPDEDLFEIERRWHNIPTAIRKSMRENASKYKT